MDGILGSRTTTALALRAASLVLAAVALGAPLDHRQRMHRSQV
jgi:hypothetical protein